MDTSLFLQDCLGALLFLSTGVQSLQVVEECPGVRPHHYHSFLQALRNASPVPQVCTITLSQFSNTTTFETQKIDSFKWPIYSSSLQRSLKKQKKHSKQKAGFSVNCRSNTRRNIMSLLRWRYNAVLARYHRHRYILKHELLQAIPTFASNMVQMQSLGCEVPKTASKPS